MIGAPKIAVLAKLSSWTAGGSLLLAVTGCAVFQPKIVEANSLRDAEYALCFSASSRDIDMSGDGTFGKIVIAYEDGRFAKVDTAGMDMCEITWAENGLYFSDRLADYQLDNTGLKRVESPKTDSQYSLLAVSPETVVGVYNLGFSDSGGYTTQVVETSDSQSDLREVEGSYEIVAQCDGVVYGIGNATGPYSETGDLSTEPMLLNKLTGTVNGKEQKLGRTTLISYVFPTSDVPCVDGKIYFISDTGDGGLDYPASLVVSVWDTGSGEYEQIPLSANPEVAAQMSNPEIGMPQVTSHSVKDGKITWYGANNLVLSTDLGTGRTEVLFETEGTNDSYSASRVVFTETETVLLVDNGDGSPYRIVRYDRVTGEERGRTILDADPKAIDSGYVFRAFAVRP